MSTPDDREKALTALVQDAKRSAPSDPDWDRVEERLMARVRAEGSSGVRGEPSVSGPRAPLLALALAAAALVAVVLLRDPGGVAPRDAEPARAATEAPARTVPAETLRSGSVVESQSAPVTVAHAGHATWTLDPGSSGRVETLGDVVTISLERGSLSAHVEKSPRPESFVVLAGPVRVAVHGTRFTVRRDADAVQVRLTEGVVRVSRVDGGASTDLVAPAELTVPLALPAAPARAEDVPAAPIDRTPPAVPPSGYGSAHAHRASPSEDAPAAAAAGEPGVPARPSGEPAIGPASDHPADASAVPPGAEPVVSRAQRAVQQCLAQSMGSSGEVRVTFTTRMELRVTPEGRVGEALFSPPLAPAAQSCVDANLGALRMPATRGGFVATRDVELRPRAD